MDYDNIRLRAARDTAERPSSSCCWQHAWPPAWGWRREWARCAAARCRCSLTSPAAFCRRVRCHLATTEGRGRVTRNPLDTTTFEESNVRASEAMPGGMVSVISRTGSASSQKTSPISKEPPQQHAPAGAVSASRSSATGRQKPAKLSCAAVLTQCNSWHISRAWVWCCRLAECCTRRPRCATNQPTPAVRRGVARGREMRPRLRERRKRRAIVMAFKM
jgi:hypothetical protein